MNQTLTMPGVLTLEELAGYLRLPQETVEQQAIHGKIPGRQIENTWRFLKAAIDDWLTADNGKMALLNQAGAFADDDRLSELRDSIYAARGRSETDS